MSVKWEPPEVLEKLVFKSDEQHAKSCRVVYSPIADARLCTVPMMKGTRSRIRVWNPDLS